MFSVIRTKSDRKGFIIPVIPSGTSTVIKSSRTRVDGLAVIIVNFIRLGIQGERKNIKK